MPKAQYSSSLTSNAALPKDLASRLSDAQDELSRLAQFIQKTVQSSPEEFDHPNRRALLTNFEEAYAHAVQRLAHPTLSVATIGTTSSGKSTLVNALAGRRIAPIDSGEMSGGVLTLRHDDTCSLTIAPSDEGGWESGTWSNISDEDAYNRIRNDVMRTYHDLRKNQSCKAPRVHWSGPLLPITDSDLLRLPVGVNFEIVDLPGLKSIQDRDNLSVIQEHVRRSVNLITLDYRQTDEEHRKKLLEELKQTVERLGGRLDSMIFVLNRIDGRGEDDEPLATRIALLQSEIQGVLKLDHAPEIIPFKARMLYRAQCMWNAAHSDPSERLEHLNQLFNESASSIRRMRSKHRDLRGWLANLEAEVEDKEMPPEEDLHRLLVLVRDWSGGTALWTELAARIESSFNALIIFPAITETLEAYRVLSDDLQALSGIRKESSKETLERVRENLVNILFQFESEVERTRANFRDKMGRAIECLKSDDPAEHQKATKELGQGFEPLLSAVREVSSDLTLKLIVPVRDALKDNTEVHVLAEKLDELPPHHVSAITRAYDSFSRKIVHAKQSSGKLVFDAKAEDEVQLKNLKDAERAARRLYQAMREGLSHRAEFTLQGKAVVIQEALASLLREQNNAIAKIVKEDWSELAFGNIIESLQQVELSTSKPDLPERFFELPEVVEQRGEERKEVVGMKKVKETYTTGTCFTSEHTHYVNRKTYANIEYNVLELADIHSMAQAWSLGVKNGEESLWETLREWISGQLSESSLRFSSSIQRVLTMVQHTIDDQLALEQKEYEQALQRWQRIDGYLQESDISYNHLVASFTASERV